MTALSASGLVSGYLNRPVLHDVSVAVEHGRMLGLIGPNGHGKTTLLRTLSGLVNVRAGHIHFEGQEITARPACERVEIGLVHVPQGDRLFGEMSVEENLRMGAYLRSDRDAVKRSLDEVYSLFPRLGERREQSANSLSGGERRMAAIGRGLMSDGKVLMFDEPSLGLAPLVIEQIYGALRKLIASSRAILVVEENPSRLIGIADTICLMDAGRVVWSGTSADVASSQDVFATYLGGN